MPEATWRWPSSGRPRKLLDPALQMTFWLPAAEAALAQALEVG